jgi:hypothetical protein
MVPPHPSYFGSGTVVPKLTACYAFVVSATDSLLARNRSFSKEGITDKAIDIFLTLFEMTSFFTVIARTAPMYKRSRSLLADSCEPISYG